MNHNNLSDQKICHGCLCTSRRLSPIDKYYDLYKKVLGPYLKRNYRNDNKNLLICWECRMVFKNLDKFVQKVVQAQDFFIKNKKKRNGIIHVNEDISLSSLCTKTQLDFNYCFTYGDLDAKMKHEHDGNETKISLNELKVDIAVECKEAIDVLENYDNESNTDDNDYGVQCNDDGNISNDDIALENIGAGISDYNADTFNLENSQATEIKEEITDNAMLDYNHQDLKNVTIVGEIKKKCDTKYKPEPQRYKVTFLSNDDQDKSRFYKRITIDSDEVRYWLKKEKSKVDTFKIKCGQCLTGFITEEQFVQHNKVFHSLGHLEDFLAEFYIYFLLALSLFNSYYVLRYTNVKMRYECDMCGVRLSKKAEMAAHQSEHYTKIGCMLCDYNCYRTCQINDHLASVHQRVIECLMCCAKFPNMFEYARHHKAFHKQFICDYCGQKFSRKKIIERHMQRRHTRHECTICGIQFKTFISHRWHMRTQHVKNPTEETFCVECNIQFDNVIKYKNHFRVFVKHRPPTKKSFPCPECGKIYNKQITMKYHYNYEHLKKTQFICTKCDRYFLNGFRLRLHTASVHDKVSKPKNKICSLCGRGFSTNRILENHIRTHTGERPFLCTQCPAAFAQKTALMTHTRAIHKVERGN
ncbi:uncharacterized protein ACR2FA_010048 [Aphomia sociella]